MASKSQEEQRRWFEEEQKFNRSLKVATMGSKPLPSPPFVDVPGIANFRDIGGYSTSTGKHVRKGLVFRSADPSRATKEGLEKMSRDLDIKVIFDLRSAPEIRRDGPEWAGVEVDKQDVFEPYGIKREWVPVFAEKDYGPEQIALRYKEYKRGGEGFVRAYHDILVSGTKAYTTIFRHLAQETPSPCLIHCTAGKDRTGVLTALMFLLVGVNDDEIAQEYSLTDLGLEHLRPLFTERLLKNPAMEGDEQGVRNMIGSNKANMTASLEMIRRDFGGVEGYLREKCGFGEEEVERLRANLVQA